MPYYSSDQTERSQGVLRQLVDVVPEAVLIGGWGTWVRLHGEMSHDIDLIVEHAELATLRSQIGDFSSSTHVGGQKYRGDFNNIHVDLYVPHQSRLGGKLKLRVEDLGRYRESVDGFSVLSVEAHMATKMAALLDRYSSGRQRPTRIARTHSSLQPEPSCGEGLHRTRDGAHGHRAQWPNEQSDNPPR
jgi:hypothetical protein